jgi:hypothetical protein
MHTAWVNNYSAIVAAFDPRENGTSASKKIAKLKKKNLGKSIGLLLVRSTLAILMF